MTDDTCTECLREADHLTELEGDLWLCNGCLWDAAQHASKMREIADFRTFAPAPKLPLGTIYVQNQYREARPGSQRRCYYGCFPSSDWETLWSEWRPLITDVEESALDGWPGFTRDGLKTQYKWEPNK